MTGRSGISPRMALAGGLAGALMALAPAGATAADPTSRLQGDFTMSGKVDKSKNVEGEKKGQKVTRRWVFKPSCASGVCTKVKLERSTASGSTDKVTLKWDGKKQYSYKATRYGSEKCGGKTTKKALRSIITITARVTETMDVNGVPVSTKVKGTFAAVHRVTCPGGTLNAHSNLSYTGTRDDLPEPPEAAFDWEFNGSSSAPSNVSFFDGSGDPDGGPITAWSWNFGDGGTSSERNPSHTFQSPGTYTVNLTVTDDDGQTASAQRQVVIDPPQSVEGGFEEF